MPEYLSPGVYIEEIAGPQPIQGVGTSTGAFVGIAERGPVNSAQLITNFTQFATTFGSFTPSGFLAYAIRHFFNEGGARCYVVRAFKNSAAPSTANPRPDVASATLNGAGTPGPVLVTVYAASPGAWGNAVSVQASAAGFDPNDPSNAGKRFKIQVFETARGATSPTLVETFDNVSMIEFDSAGFPNANHIEQRINGVSNYINVVHTIADPTQTDPPVFTASPIALTGGGNGATLAASDLVGGAAAGTSPATGLFAFDPVEDINIVAIPDLVGPAFTAQQSRDATLQALAYCGNRQDCFFIADVPSGQTPQNALAYKRGQAPFSGNAFNTKYGALYYPWITVADPITSGQKLFPPSGAVAGRYAGTDIERGVQKAAAGTESGYINSALDIERVVTKGEQDVLNPEGIDVIRKFPDAGIVIWGARTLTTDPEWIYVNVRRLVTFIEQSILRGTQNRVFEPIDSTLFKGIVRDVGAFLREQWLSGLLFGDKAEQAFFVQCDNETNPPESIALGRVVTRVGIAPVRPAEFVIFQIQQISGSGSVSE